MQNKRRKGLEAENHALDYLLKQGCKLIKRNFYYHTGEIDLVITDHTFLVFVEVRERNNPHFGGALVSVDYQKQSRIISTAHYFLMTHKIYATMPCRFDIIAIENNEQADNKSKIEWLKNAFQANTTH